MFAHFYLSLYFLLLELRMELESKVASRQLDAGRQLAKQLQSSVAHLPSARQPKEFEELRGKLACFF